MFARILYLCRTAPRESDFSRRLCETLRDAGHAVHVCARADEPDAVRPALRAFRPTLVIWDAASLGTDAARAVLGGCPHRKVALLGRPEDASGLPAGVFDAVVCEFTPGALPSGCLAGDVPAIELPPAPDTAYREAITSDPSPSRAGVASVQPVDVAARGESLPEGVPLTPLDPSCPGSLGERIPGACAAYWLRHARYAAFLDGPGLSCASLSMRVSEGCVVLVGSPAREGIPCDELRDAVVPFEPGALGDVVASLEADPELRESALAGQRAALDRIDPLERSLPGVLSRLDDADVRRDGPLVLALDEPATEVVLFGWFGARNFGDDLLMGIVADRVGRRYANPLVSVIGANAAVVEEEYGYPAMTPDEKASVRGALRRARAVVFCGGLLFDDPLAQTAGELELFLDPWIEPTGQAAVSILARLHGVPSVYLGIGAGPVENGETRAAVRAIAMAGSLLLPRDEGSRDLFASSGVPSDQVIQAADLVLGSRDYVLARAEEADGIVSGDYFVVSLRDWHLNPEGFEGRVAELVGELAARTGCRPVFVPLDVDDVAIHRRVSSLLGEGCEPVLLGERPEEGALLGFVCGSRFAVAMRLHCSILHHLLGRPVVGLDYNDKIGEHFRQLDQGGMLLPLDFGPRAASDAAGRLASMLESPDPALAEGVARGAARVERAFDELWAAIASSRPVDYGREVFYPRRLSRFESELVAARARIAELESEAKLLERSRDEARREASDLRESHSFRLGRALLRLPSMVKRRLRG